MANFDARAGTASLWLVAVAALIAVIGWETDWGRRMAPLPATPSAVAQPVAVALLPEYKLDGGVEARRETVERPAFVPTRRPAPATPPPEAAKPRMQRGQFVLTGTAVVDQQAMAFLREAASGKSRTVRKGDTINGMTVAEVAPDRVTLAMGDETEGLALKVAPGPRMTIQPAQPPGPGGVPGRPGIPGQPPAVAGAPGAAPQPGVPQPGVAQPAQAGAGQADPDAEARTLLERRRAARAAEAAAAAARAASQPGAVPGQAQAPAGVDPGWAEVYRRMQQPRR